jgi:uncharacterized protein YbjT (DUF2867 family)
MKIVVIGGSGLIGSKVVAHLAAAGHDAVAASPASGVDTITGQGLERVLEGASTVLDVSNSPSFADDDVMRFFLTSTGNLLAAESKARVTHHVALSVVGADTLPDSGYLRAKVAQEALIKASTIPWSLVRATQFFEFLSAIAGGSTDGEMVRVSSAHMQPIAAADVASAMTKAVLSAPTRATLEIAGPERVGMDVLIARRLAAQGDTRRVIGDPSTKYFGTLLTDDSLTPREGAWIGPTTFADWLGAEAAAGRK